MILAVPVETALRRKAAQAAREQDLGEGAPETLRGTGGGAEGACFLFRKKLQGCLLGDVSVDAGLLLPCLSLSPQLSWGLRSAVPWFPLGAPPH